MYTDYIFGSEEFSISIKSQIIDKMENCLELKDYVSVKVEINLLLNNRF